MIIYMANSILVLCVCRFNDEGLLPLGYGVNKLVDSMASFMDMEAKENGVFKQR